MPEHRWQIERPPRRPYPSLLWRCGRSVSIHSVTAAVSWARVGILRIEPVGGGKALHTVAAAHSTDTNSISGTARFTLADDPKSYDAPIPARASARLSSGSRPAGPTWANG